MVHLSWAVRACDWHWNWCNTAVEAVVDLVTTERHPLAQIAKDTAAGAVLIASTIMGSDRRTSDLCTERAFVSEAALKMIRFYERRYILWN